jgi:hypothetical protein
MRRSAELPTASDWAETRGDGRQDLSRCCRVTRDQYGGRQQSLFRMSSSYEVRPRFRQSKSKSDQIKFQRPFMPHLRLAQIRKINPARRSCRILPWTLRNKVPHIGHQHVTAEPRDQCPAFGEGSITRTIISNGLQIKYSSARRFSPSMHRPRHRAIVGSILQMS